MKVAVYSSADDMIVIGCDSNGNVDTDEVSLFFSEDNRFIGDYDIKIVELPLCIVSEVRLQSYGP